MMDGIDVRKIDDIDKDCVDLCLAMNQFKGIHTTSSCQGHENHKFWIFFSAELVQDLAPILYYCDVCHSGYSGWQVIARTDCCLTTRPSFLLEGPEGQEGAEGALAIAQLLNDEYNQKG